MDDGTGIRGVVTVVDGRVRHVVAGTDGGIFRQLVVKLAILRKYILKAT